MAIHPRYINPLRRSARYVLIHKRSGFRLRGFGFAFQDGKSTPLTPAVARRIASAMGAAIRFGYEIGGKAFGDVPDGFTQPGAATSMEERLRALWTRAQELAAEQGRALDEVPFFEDVEDFIRSFFDEVPEEEREEELARAEAGLDAVARGEDPDDPDLRQRAPEGTESAKGEPGPDEDGQVAQGGAQEQHDGEAGLVHAPECDMGEDCTCGAETDPAFVDEVPPAPTASSKLPMRRADLLALEKGELVEWAERVLGLSLDGRWSVQRMVDRVFEDERVEELTD